METKHGGIDGAPKPRFLVHLNYQTPSGNASAFVYECSASDEWSADILARTALTNDKRRVGAAIVGGSIVRIED